MDELTSIATVLRRTDAAIRAGERGGADVVPTGFHPLDTYLGGGLRAGELALLGGPQGLGKTTFALQAARNVARSGRPVLYFCYEHDEVGILTRLVALESGLLGGVEAASLKRVRQAVDSIEAHPEGLAGRLRALDAGESVDEISAYADRLFVHRSSGRSTSVDELRKLIDRYTGTGEARPLVVVDYLQKIPVPGGSAQEDERMTLVVEGLKDLALDLGVPVLAIVAADKEGLAARGRLRIHHLRGSSALAYEADVVLMLNEKFDIVARHHLVYDVGNAERFRDWVVVTIEKNRSGLDHVDLEFRKAFEFGRFEPVGGSVNEQLVDGRVYVE